MNSDFLRYLKLVAIGLVCFSLYACESRSSPSTVDAKSDVSQRVATANIVAEQETPESGAQVKSHRHAAKPGAAVKLKNSQPLTVPAPGVHELLLYLMSASTSGHMIVEVVPGEGLEIVFPAPRFEFNLHDGGEYALPVKVSALKEGRFYINLHISLVTGDHMSSRVIAAIVQVGEPVIKMQKAMSTKSTSKPAEHVISLPAQETVSPR